MNIPQTTTINSWQEFIIKAGNLGYDEQEVKIVLRRRFGKGGGATRDYQQWIVYLEHCMLYRELWQLCQDWDKIWNSCPTRPPPMRYGTIDEMKAHIERYRDYDNTKV
jgi:hypothetical protein